MIESQRRAAYKSRMPPDPNKRILTTVVGSYPVPDWLSALPSEQALVDATALVFKIQELAGIDLVVDGELYRFDVNHPDTNGMIEYFIRPLDGIRSRIGREDVADFSRIKAMQFRRKPAGVVEGPIQAGTLDLVSDFNRSRALTRSPLKFTVTGPHMLSRTLMDQYYKDPGELAMAIAVVLADQLRQVDAEVVQVDEANITGAPADASWALAAINCVLDALPKQRAVHLCFGNYGGQPIQKGTWDRLVQFINGLHADHVVLEMARRDDSELDAIRAIKPEMGLGIGVIDIKSTIIETADDVARRIERAVRRAAPGQIQYVHPDCGFWMLKRTIADRKMRALVEGRDLFYS